MIPYYYGMPQIKVPAGKSDHPLCVYLYKATIIYISKLQMKFTSVMKQKGANILVKQPRQSWPLPKKPGPGGVSVGARGSVLPRGPRVG